MDCPCFPSEPNGYREEKLKLQQTHAKVADIKREQKERRNKQNSLEVFPKSYFFKLGKYSRANPWSDPVLSLRNVDFH